MPKNKPTHQPLYKLISSVLTGSKASRPSTSPQEGSSGYMQQRRQVNKEIDELLNGVQTVKGGKVQR